MELCVIYCQAVLYKHQPCGKYAEIYWNMESSSNTT